MFIIFNYDDPIPCPYCNGKGEIRLDLFDCVEVRVVRRRTFTCGHCEGYGYVDQEIQFDSDFSLQPPEPDVT